MELFPAIDLRDGKAVRLVQGDYNQMTVFSDRPEEVALGFKEQGAKNLHVVDLDGAKDAALANFDTIEKLIKTTGLFVEVGGGIRNEASIDKYLSLGAGRVILGTVAVTNYPFLRQMDNLSKKWSANTAIKLQSVWTRRTVLWRLTGGLRRAR